MTLDKLIHHLRLEVILRSSASTQSNVPYAQICSHLVGCHKIPHVLLHHPPLYGQTLDIGGGRLCGENVFQGIAFAQVYLDEPRRKHHPLCAILKGVQDWLSPSLNKETLTRLSSRSNRSERYIRSASRSSTSTNRKQTYSKDRLDFA